MNTVCYELVIHVNSLLMHNDARDFEDAKIFEVIH